ncbi:MAG TPA: transcriptional regulator [Bryobacteraceae bacterium]|nr:transcriptional regulator [Bryobacteraceae bacterium]
MGSGYEFQYQFGPFCLDPIRRVLLRGGERVALTAKSLATLTALVERAGETVGKNELLDVVWEHTAVEENSLNQCISAVRKALGERRGQHEYIVTVTGVGYRFVAPVTLVPVVKDDEGSQKDAPMAESQTSAAPPRAKSWFHWRKVAVIAAALLVAVAIYGIRGRVSASAKRRSAVILRLKNLSGTQETAWLSTAIGEMLYHELGAPGSGALRLMPPEDAARMEVELPVRRTATETLRDIRSYTGVEYALGGAVTVLSGAPGTPVHVDLFVQDLRSGEMVAKASAEGAEGQTFSIVRSLADQVRPALGMGATPGSRPSPAPSSARAMQLYSSGIAALRAWDFIQAKDVLLEAVKADPTNALCYSALSAALSELGYEQNAVDTAKRAFDLSASLDELDRLAIEGRYRLTTHNWPRAAEIYASIWNLVPESIPDASALLNAYWQSGKAEEAKRVIARLRSLPALKDDPQVDLLDAQTAGATFSDFGRIARLAEQAAEKAKRRQMRDVYARARMLQASAMYSTGDRKAAPVAEEARALCSELHDWMCVAHSLRMEGNRALVAGRMREAEASYNQALLAARQSGNLAEQPNELNGLGLLHLGIGDLDAANLNFQEALRLLTEIRMNTALTRNNYARVLIYAGKLGEAREQATFALAEARASHQIESEAFALTELAQLDQIGGDPRNAVVLGKKAVALAAQSGRTLARFETGLALASALSTTGESNAAQSVLRTAAAADSRATDDDLSFALAQARLLRQASDYAQAVPHARAAANRAKATQAAWFEVEADSVLALTLLRLGQADEAYAVAVRAMAIPQTGARTFSKLDARFAELAARTAGQNSDSLMGLAAEARKAGYIELDFEIRLAHAEQAASSGRKAEAQRLANELRLEAARRGYGSVAARASRVAGNRS